MLKSQPILSRNCFPPSLLACFVASRHKDFPDYVYDLAIAVATYLMKSVGKFGACRGLRASGGARCFGPTGAVGWLAG